MCSVKKEALSVTLCTNMVKRKERQKEEQSLPLYHSLFHYYQVE